jgi:hypothetical protein
MHLLLPNTAPSREIPRNRPVSFFVAIGNAREEI